MAVTQERLDELWDFSDAAASEARFAGAAAAVGDAGERAEFETQRARALGLQERYAEADAVLDGIVGESDLVAARVAIERGRVRNSSGEPDAAIPLFLDAERRAAAAGSPFLRVDALHMLAIAEPARAGEWTQKAFDALAEASDPRTLRWHVSLRNNAGWALFDAGRLDEALSEFEAAKDAAVCWGTPQQVVWADEALAECRAAIEGAG